MKQHSRLLRWGIGLVVAFLPVLGQNTTRTASPILLGLPDQGVTLSGDPNAPVISNTSNRKILGCVLRSDDTAGHIAYRRILLLGQTMRVPPGGQRALSPGAEVRIPGGSTVSLAKVALDAVLFEDGELVGPDRGNGFDVFTAKINGERGLHQKILATRSAGAAQKDGVWSEIIVLAQGRPLSPAKTDTEMAQVATQREIAKELLRVRDKFGDDAVYDLAARSAGYPTVWRKQ